MRRLTGSASGAATVALMVAGLGNGATADETPHAARSAVSGRELFTREWVPGDDRSHGGDGLGPLFNESSCVACHSQGGIGGGGPASRNAQILTAFRNVSVQSHTSPPQPQPQTLPARVFRSFFGDPDRTTRPSVPTARPETRFADPFPTPADQTTRPSVPTAPQVRPTAPPGVKVVALASGEQAIDLAHASPVAGPAPTPEQAERERKELAKVHPGFQMSLSVVLHRSATYTEYAPWRQQFAGFARTSQDVDGAPITFFATPQTPAVRQPAASASGNVFSLKHAVRQEAQVAAQQRMFNQAMQHGSFAVVRSERNTTALFGDGLIDAIPNAALEELEKRQAEKREVSGRVSRLKDGRVGRFGWKAQTAGLEDFVLTACAVELGLNVPGHAQAGVPHKLDYRPAGLDLNAAECRALVDFVRDLPAPQQRRTPDSTEAVFVDAGQKLFETVGCAACHVPDVGKATGIFSDLLLHDLGPELGDSGSSYGIFVPDSTPEGTPAPAAQVVSGPGSGPAPVVGATRQEWRTPPLWGVRDSGPYLHDGRAETIEQAIAFHGGEADRSAQRYFELTAAERFQFMTFLKSLVAPDALAQAAAP